MISGRRRFNRVLVAIAAAALTNIAVAWVLALTSEVASAPAIAAYHYADDGSMRLVNVQRKSGAIRYSADRPHTPSDIFRAAIEQGRIPRAVDILPQFAMNRLASDELRVNEAYGWPLPGLRCGFDIEHDGKWRMKGAIPVLRQGSRKAVGLPLRLIWLNFAIDTALYATLWYAAIWGWRDLRGLRRARLGCCARCGYPVGESNTCSECGNPLRLPARSVARP